MAVATHPGVVQFVNDEARSAGALEGTVTLGTRRRLLLAALSGRYAFPLRASVRAYVVGSRDIEPSPHADARPASGHYLEVVPEGLTRGAFDLVGPVLVPFDRPLEPGSVLHVDLEFPDPSGYEMQPPALVARLASARVVVAVER